MARSRKRFQDVLIEDIDIKGRALSEELEGGRRLRVDAHLLIPGDRADLESMRKKGDYLESRPLSLIAPSPWRVEPWCPHFEYCGGCSWQHASYAAQLEFKDKILAKALAAVPELPASDGPTLGSPREIRYRNKLEYSFSTRRWFESPESGGDSRALGFFVPRQNNRVVDIHQCFHQDEISDAIRNRVREFALERKISFHDPIEHRGLLRTLVVRITGTGEIMVALVVYEDDAPAHAQIHELLDMLHNEFPEIKSLYYIVNSKMNDAYGDCPAFHYRGETAVYERLEDLRFRIGPLSFFQVNPLQTARLYAMVREYAGLQGNELVYDLYTGTGSIALFLAARASRVIGIEYVEAAVEDARINCKINGVDNCSFFSGDMKDVLTSDFISANGRPDVLICDPPRAGMHPDVLTRILESGAQKLVYVSCNPVSLGRDLLRLTELYRPLRYRGVDMSPQTPHVEAVMLLERRK